MESLSLSLAEILGLSPSLSLSLAEHRLALRGSTVVNTQKVPGFAAVESHRIWNGLKNGASSRVSWGTLQFPAEKAIFAQKTKRGKCKILDPIRGDYVDS